VNIRYALLRRPGAVLSRAQLEQQVYAWSDSIESNAIEFIIHSLRKKVGTDGIKNVRGLGWMVDQQSCCNPLDRSWR
jgi:two-component system, OmpR family, response regulator